MRIALAAFLLFALPPVARAGVQEDWADILALDSGPKKKPGSREEAVLLARTHIQLQRKVLEQFLARHPSDERLFDARMRLAAILAAEGKTVMLITHSVEEAIYLSSKIIVVTARPSRIRTVLDVPFAYPRDEGLHERPEFGELRSHIRDLVMKEYAAQQQQVAGNSARNLG